MKFNLKVKFVEIKFPSKNFALYTLICNKLQIEIEVIELIRIINIYAFVLECFFFFLFFIFYFFYGP